MIVIKHGREDTLLSLFIQKHEPVRFTCKRCGCVFMACKNEYRSGYTPWPEHAEVHITNCPECRTEVIAHWGRMGVNDLKEVKEFETDNL